VHVALAAERAHLQRPHGTCACSSSAMTQLTFHVHTPPPLRCARCSSLLHLPLHSAHSDVLVDGSPPPLSPLHDPPPPPRSIRRTRVKWISSWCSISSLFLSLVHHHTPFLCPPPLLWRTRCLLDLPPPLDMLGHARWWFLPPSPVALLPPRARRRARQR
jgi:hypothetical protein